MMLPCDMILIEDLKFREYVELYSNDEGQFFTDFASSFDRLIELGIFSDEPIQVIEPIEPPEVYED